MVGQSPPFCVALVTDVLAACQPELSGRSARNHKRKRLRDVVQNVERHVHDNGPWRDSLSHVYNAPESTAAGEPIAVEAQAKVAAGGYEPRIGLFSLLLFAAPEDPLEEKSPSAYRVAAADATGGDGTLAYVYN